MAISATARGHALSLDRVAYLPTGVFHIGRCFAGSSFGLVGRPPPIASVATQGEPVRPYVAARALVISAGHSSSRPAA